MARQRRGGFRPPELRGTLGTLLRTAVPAVRDVLERGAREGRARLDDALSGRRRSDALAELGEIVLDLIRRGEIDVAEIPEVSDIVQHLDELDAEAEPAPTPRALNRKRFDDRGPPTERGKKRAKPDDDGTVSSRTWSPPSSSSSTALSSRGGGASPGSAARVWRPTEARPADEITARERPRAAPMPNPAKKGGISFDDDDLADYMHPDDVPPKDGES
jgi:hypothetical protein